MAIASILPVTRYLSGDQAVNTLFILSIQQNQNPPLTVLGTGILNVFLRTALFEYNKWESWYFRDKLTQSQLNMEWRIVGATYTVKENSSLFATDQSHTMSHGVTMTIP